MILPPFLIVCFSLVFDNIRTIFAKHVCLCKYYKISQYIDIEN